MKSQIIDQVKEAIRNPFAWPGGYPVYSVMADGHLLCAACARENFRQIAHDTIKGWNTGWDAIGAEILWEGREECAQCGKTLESAYGEDE
jgi:hypothetical protein